MIGTYLEQNDVFPKGLNGVKFLAKIGFKIGSFSDPDGDSW